MAEVAMRLSRLFFVIFFLGFVPPAWCEAKVLFPFQGKIDFQQKTFSLLTTSANKEDSLSVDVSRTSDTQYHLTINIDHFRTPIFDISSVLECPLEVTHSTNKQMPGLSGKLWSKYTLINYQPVREISGNFEVKDQTLIINSLVIGNWSGEGSIKFARPYSINLVLRVSEIDIADFLNFWIKDNTRMASGQFGGQIVLNGPLNRLQVKGNFAAYNGRIKSSAFENLLVNFEGVYPTMTLVNSTGIKPNGLPFSINGSIDLSDRANFVKQVKSLSKQAIVQKEGENLEWTLKRIQSEQHSDMTTELKYLKKKGDETSIRPDEDDMLGVERSIQF